MVDLGVIRIAFLDLEPIAQVPHNLVGHHPDAHLVEGRLGVQRVDQDLETFTPRVAAKVLRPDTFAGAGNQLLDLHVHPCLIMPRSSGPPSILWVPRMSSTPLR